MSYREEIDKDFGQQWKPSPKSLQQVILALAHRLEGGDLTEMDAAQSVQS